MDRIFTWLDVRNIEEISKRIKENRWIINQQSTWDTRKQLKYIESVLLGLPLHYFLATETLEGKIVILDGSQRIMSLYKFFSDDIILDLSASEELNGKKFTEMSWLNQDYFCNRGFYVHIINHDVSDDFRADIVERLT